MTRPRNGARFLCLFACYTHTYGTQFIGGLIPPTEERSDGRGLRRNVYLRYTVLPWWNVPRGLSCHAKALYVAFGTLPLWWHGLVLYAFCLGGG